MKGRAQQTKIDNKLYRSPMVKLKDIIGESQEEFFQDFDLTLVQDILGQLAVTETIDIAHAERNQQLALRGADILASYLGKLIKTVSYLEARVDSVKNKASLEYKADDGKTTADMKKYAGAASPEVEALQIKLASAKGSKAVLERKYDILIKTHHFYKDLTAKLDKGIVPHRPSSVMTNRSPDWE